MIPHAPWMIQMLTEIGTYILCSIREEKTMIVYKCGSLRGWKFLHVSSKQFLKHVANLHAEWFGSTKAMNGSCSVFRC